MHVRVEVLPFLLASWSFGVALLLGVRWRRRPWRTSVSFGIGAAVILCAYFLFFFRDPERIPPGDADAVLAGADGTVAAITEVQEDEYLKTACVRISIFLSLFDVHVNRAPISGQSTFLGYFPGKRLFTFQEKSSDVNQHNKILIEGDRIRCLVCQIVGPVCRRVVYWPPHDTPLEIVAGERIGMMKFGSRLDMYLPMEDVAVSVRPGDRTRAGETIVARVERRTR